MSKTQREQNKPLSKWFMVAGSFLLLMVLMGIINNCYSLFIIPVTVDLGFTRTEFSLCQSLIFLFTMLGSAIGGNIFDRLGILSTMRVACIILAAAYFSYAFATSLLFFYILSSLVGFCMGLTTTVPISLILKDWFHEKVGLAIGMAFMGSGVGGLVFNPIANTFLSNYGWTTAYKLLAAILAIVSISIVFFVLEENKKSKTPPNLWSQEAGKGQQSKAKQQHTRNSKKAPLLAIILLFSTACSILIFTIAPYLQDVGYSASFAATSVSIAMAVLAAGKLLLGIMLDKYGLNISTHIAFGFTLLGLVSLAAFNHPLMLPLILLGVLFGCPYGTVGVPVIALATCDEKDNRGAVIGRFTAFANLGAALSPILSGFVFDATGSYVPLFIGAAAMIGASMATIRHLLS